MVSSPWEQSEGQMRYEAPTVSRKSIKIITPARRCGCVLNVTTLTGIILLDKRAFDPNVLPFVKYVTG